MVEHVTKRAGICLNMIVRNEAHIIHECLNSVAPYISSWVIVDTGSDDGTQDVIKNHMAGLGIPGELHERPWVNFGHNRTEAYDLAQGHGDYIFIIDADDLLVGTPDFAGMSADVCSVRVRHPDRMEFWRTQIFRDGTYGRCEGVIHEYPVWDDYPHVCENVEGEYYIESRRLGWRNRDGDEAKAARDRDLLLARIEDNPEDARSVFHLASCYSVLGDHVSARKWFARRIEMGGWAEEVYVSMYDLAGLMLDDGEPWHDVQDALLGAWEFRPARAEPLHGIACWYREEQRYRLGYQFARLAAEIPYPEQDALFIPADVYAWQATDEQAICAAGIGRFAEAFTLCRQLLARPHIPEADRRRIAANRDLCVPGMLDAASGYPREVVGRLRIGVGGDRKRGAAGRSGSPRSELREAEVVVSLVAGPDRDGTEQTLNSFLNCCSDVARVGRFLVVDAGLSAQDRAMLHRRYGFLEFAQPGSVDEVREQAGPLAYIRSQIHGRFWLHLGRGWRFFAPEDFIARLMAVLDAEPQVFQVGINFTDAVKLTGESAADEAVRRTPDAGRYLFTDVVAGGPAMFDTARLDGAGGVPGSEMDPIAALGRRAAAAGLRTASLDEVLCIAAA